MLDSLDLVRAVHRVWSAGDVAAVDTLFSVDFTAHWPVSSETPVRRGRDGVRWGVKRIRDAFPDWREDIVDMSDDRVVTRYRSTGTHRGFFWGVPPNGRRVEIEEMSIYRADGMISEGACSTNSRVYASSGPHRNG